MLSMQMIATTFSLTKCIASSICFVLAWRIRLWKSNTSMRLSHSRVDTRRDSSQRNPDVVCVNAWYSAYVLDLAISTCFFKLQTTRLRPKKTHESKVEPQSLGSLVQSESLYARGENFERCVTGTSSNSCIIVSLK